MRSKAAETLVQFTTNTFLRPTRLPKGKPGALCASDRPQGGSWLLEAAALALMEVPEVNVSFAEDAILRHHHADIGVAVALPNGLITPIIRQCDEKSIRQIALEVKDMAARAAEKRLKPHEYEGGSFSISNLGMFGIEQFTAVINPPQAAILAVGCATTDWQNVNGNMVSQQMMRVTLSCDHRAIDGAVGAQFLAALAEYIENPLLLTI